MSPVEALLRELRHRGIRLYPDGDRLRYTSPKGAITAEDRQHIQEHRVAILALLMTRSEKPRALDPVLGDAGMLTRYDPDITLFTISELTIILQCTHNVVRAMLADGRLAGFQLGGRWCVRECALPNALAPVAIWHGR